MTPANPADAEERARQTHGTSGNAIYRAVAAEVAAYCRALPNRPTLYDIGCGTGLFRAEVQSIVADYVGVDIIRYDAFPADAEFHATSLDVVPWPIADSVSDVTVSIETVEHLENPRQLFREIARITRPGGLVVVSTPNQLSLLSKCTLIFKNQFNAFQDGPGLYPAHITALLDIDLIRIANECGLRDARVRFTDSGRVPGTSKMWPKWLGGGRSFSDNVLVRALK